MSLRTLLNLGLILVLAGACGGPDRPIAGEAESPAGADMSAPHARAVDAMTEFGTTATNVFFYYEDLERAHTFYKDVLGLRTTADYGYARIMQVAPRAFLTLVDAEHGMHSSEEPKTTAIALVTDQLDEWWQYIGTQDVQLRSTDYTPTPGSAHDGFVAVDPEGYLLEFERFNPHPENDRFMPVLDAAETLYAETGASNVPAGLGFKATIVWFYYNDLDAIQRFYEDVMGFDLIVDQGWAKIYPIGPTGYFGLVDESRGMHNFTEEKAVTLSIFTDDIDGWYGYVNQQPNVEMRSEEIHDSDNYRAFIAYDPGGYYLEWDVFKPSDDNATLLPIIAE